MAEASLGFDSFGAIESETRRFCLERVLWLLPPLFSVTVDANSDEKLAILLSSGFNFLTSLFLKFDYLESIMAHLML